MDRKFLCTHYEGPETWDSHDAEWSAVVEEYTATSAAKFYAESEWADSGCEGDPTKKPTKVAVREPATGRRWVVVECVVEWHGRSEEVE